MFNYLKVRQQILELYPFIEIRTEPTEWEHNMALDTTHYAWCNFRLPLGNPYACAYLDNTVSVVLTSDEDACIAALLHEVGHLITDQPYSKIEREINAWRGALMLNLKLGLGLNIKSLGAPMLYTYLFTGAMEWIKEVFDFGWLNESLCVNLANHFECDFKTQYNKEYEALYEYKEKNYISLLKGSRYEA